MKLPEWAKSDYEWVWSGELVRFAILTAVGTAVLLLNQWIGAVGSGAELSDGWWIPPVAGAGLGLVSWVMGKLPARTPTPEAGADWGTYRGLPGVLVATTAEANPLSPTTGGAWPGTLTPPTPDNTPDTSP